MSHSSENSYHEQDQFEEIEHIVTIEKKAPENNSKYLITNHPGRNFEEYEIPSQPALNSYNRHETGPAENDYRSVRSIPNNRVYRTNDPQGNIKMVSSRYVPSGIGKSYSTYDDPRTRGYSPSGGFGSTSRTYTKITKKKKSQNKEKKGPRSSPAYDKMMLENAEIKNMIKDFQTEGHNTGKLENKIDETYKELELLRRQNATLSEKIWKVESELNVKVVDLANKNSQVEKQALEIDSLQGENLDVKEDLETWKEKYQKEKQRNIYLEQENKVLSEANLKLEKQLSQVRQRLAECDDKILGLVKENSGLATAERMLRDKIKGMEKEIDRMNNMVSVTQSQMAPENRSAFLGSEHHFGINTTFGKDPRGESKLIQGLNSQLADLRNEKEEIKGQWAKVKREKSDQMSNLEKLNAKMEKLKSENRRLKEENEGLGRDKSDRHKAGLDLEKQILAERSRLEGEEFKNQLQEDKIAKLKAQILKIQKRNGLSETEREKVEQDWEEERENWARERGVKEGAVKDERRKRSVLEAKLNNKDEFIEKLLDMLKVPLAGYKDTSNRMGDSLNSNDYLEDEKRLYKRILEEIQVRNKQERLKDLFEIQKNMSPLNKESAQFRMGSQTDIEIEQQVIQLKKSLENATRELSDLKRKAGLRETELSEEVKSLAKQVEEMKVEREKAMDKAKKFRSSLKESEERLEEEEDKNNKKLYDLNKGMKEKEYQLKVIEHELGMKNTELEEKRELLEKVQELLRELRVELKNAEHDLHEAQDDLKTKDHLMEKLKRQAENSSKKCKFAEEELDKQTLEVDRLVKQNKRLETDFGLLKTRKSSKDQEFQERQLQLEKQKRELETRARAMDQNADIQKLSQRLMMNRQEVKDRLLTDIKKSNSVLDFLNRDPAEPEMFVNQSMANVGWDDKNYMVMNEKFRGLVELLKNKLENLGREKERLEKKTLKYKGASKEMREKFENAKSEVQMMETTNTLKEDRIEKLKEEVKDLKDAHRALAQEMEESLSKRPVSQRVRTYAEGDPARSSELMDRNTRANFHPRMDSDELRKLESEISVLKDMVNKRDFKIEQLKEVIKNNEMIYDKSIEEHNMMYNQKMQDHQNLLERLKEMADASQSFHEMIREVSEENLELKDRIDAEIRKRKRIVKALKTEIQELKVQIRGLGQLFRQMDHIKSQLNIEEVEELGESESEEEEGGEEDPRLRNQYRANEESFDEEEMEMEEEEEEEYEEDMEEEEEEYEEDMEEIDQEEDNEVRDSRLFKSKPGKKRR